MASVVRVASRVLHEHNYVLPALFLGEIALSLLIVRFISYTEIDWTTYLQQARLFLDGERDYSRIEGDTGPLVYPAGHLYAYSALAWLTEGDIKKAQWVFSGIYLAVFAAVLALYKRCKRVPAWSLALLCVSKRLHSIYLLRLFNDGLAMLPLYLSLLAWTAGRPSWTVGSILFSLALSIKMNALLYLPGLAFLLWLRVGPLHMLVQFAVIAGVQVLVAMPFLSTPELALTYFRTAFDFKREFLFRWTVNWRWVGTDLFHEKGFHKALLALHVAALLVLALKWSSMQGGALRLLLAGVTSPTRPARLQSKTSADFFFLLVMFSSNLAGIIFARSLHYQFLAWYSQQLLLLLAHSPFPWALRIALLAAIEVGWNVYPSTVASSALLTAANASVLVGVLLYSPQRPKSGQAGTKDKTA